MRKWARSIGAMSLTAETKVPREKPAPLPLYPSQIPHMDQPVTEYDPPLREARDSYSRPITMSLKPGSIRWARQADVCSSR